MMIDYCSDCDHSFCGSCNAIRPQRGIPSIKADDVGEYMRKQQAEECRKCNNEFKDFCGPDICYKTI
jgi:hypothetical protein